MGSLKKITAFILSIVLVLTMFAGAAIKTDLSKFTDSENFKEAQKNALALVNAVGVIEGIAENEIGAAGLTRAQLVKVLYVLCEGTKDGADKYVIDAFTDVAADNWAAGYIAWAYLKGIIKGVTETEFAPDAKVTPIQAAAMLARIFDAKACMDPDTFMQDAQVAAIKYQLTDGITTRNFFALTDISRGDTFIMIANALLCETENGHNLLTDVFGIEKIEGAVLSESVKQFYKNGKNTDNAYSVFTFTEIVDGDVSNIKAASDILCVEDDIDNIQDDLGCKYVIYVSKDETYNGFRTLYAAYEMDDDYYEVRTGTVNDGKLIFKDDGDKKQNVFWDDKAEIYLDNEKTNAKNFEKAYGVKNKASYKLIDNDGDGFVEYAFINRFVLTDIKGNWITGKVTYYSKDGTYGIDGTVYGWGEYFKAADGKPTWEVLSAQQDCYDLLGKAKQAVSDVKYDFYVADGLIYDVRVSEETVFNGSYGIVLDNTYPSVYKNMFYYTFLNEKNEEVSAYVERVNETSKTVKKNVERLAVNQLVYFTDWDYAEGTCSVYTADYDMSNYTYDYNEFMNQVMWRTVDEELELGYVLEDVVDLSEYDEYSVVFDRYVEEFEGYEWNYYDSKYYVYDFEDLMECLEIENPAKAYDKLVLMGAKFALAYYESVNVGTVECGPVENFQIYRANGFWSYRTYYGINKNNGLWLSIGDEKFKLEEDGDQWKVLIADGFDPGEEIGDSIFDCTKDAVKFAAEKVLKSTGKKYIVNLGYEDITYVYDEIKDDMDSYFVSDQGFLNTQYGIIFLYGRVPNLGKYDWRAYKAANITKDFGSGIITDDNKAAGRQISDEILLTCDQVISVTLKGETYVKAAAVTTSAKNDTLPTGWEEGSTAAGTYIYNGTTGSYSNLGTEIMLLGTDKKAMKIWSKADTGNLSIGSVVKVYFDENDVATKIECLEGTNIIIEGELKSEGVIISRSDGTEVKYKTNCVYMLDGESLTAFDEKWIGMNVKVCEANNITVVYIG